MLTRFLKMGAYCVLHVTKITNACVKGQNHIYLHTVYDRIFGDFPANNTVHTPYIYGSGQIYMCAMCHVPCVTMGEVCLAVQSSAVQFFKFEVFKV